MPRLRSVARDHIRVDPRRPRIFDVIWGLIPAHLRRIIGLPAWGAFALDGERYEQSQIQSRPDGKLHTQIYWNRQSGCHL